MHRPSGQMRRKAPCPLVRPPVRPPSRRESLQHQDWPTRHGFCQPLATHRRPHVATDLRWKHACQGGPLLSDPSLEICNFKTDTGPPRVAVPGVCLCYLKNLQKYKYYYKPVSVIVVGETTGSKGRKGCKSRGQKVVRKTGRRSEEIRERALADDLAVYLSDPMRGCKALREILVGCRRDLRCGALFCIRCAFLLQSYCVLLQATKVKTKVH